MSRKDIKLLTSNFIKLVKMICDDGSYEERKSKHLVIKFKYKNNPFRQVFPITPGHGGSIKKCYAETRRNLKLMGLEVPPEFAIKMFVSTSQSKIDDLVEEIWNMTEDEDNSNNPTIEKMKQEVLKKKQKFDD
tara:strand:+ start:869 stop:1267 length:399 start_codon:yes stop_codon:yes gene_type:complete